MYHLLNTHFFFRCNYHLLKHLASETPVEIELVKEEVAITVRKGFSSLPEVPSRPVALLLESLNNSSKTQAGFYNKHYISVLRNAFIIYAASEIKALSVIVLQPTTKVFKCFLFFLLYGIACGVVGVSSYIHPNQYFLLYPQRVTEAFSFATCISKPPVFTLEASVWGDTNGPPSIFWSQV